MWGGGGGRADGDGHGEEDFRAFDDVGALFTEGDLDADVVGVLRAFCGEVVGLVAGHGVRLFLEDLAGWG